MDPAFDLGLETSQRPKASGTEPLGLLTDTCRHSKSVEPVAAGSKKEKKNTRRYKSSFLSFPFLSLFCSETPSLFSLPLLYFPLLF